MADVSFYEGTETVMIDFQMGKIGAGALLDGMYEAMTSKSNLAPMHSRENWRNERKVHLVAHNSSLETCLEKAVAMLAERDHMPGKWYNQVPTASGITGPRQDRKANVDLVHWDVDNARLRLIELKWTSELKGTSDTPLSALFQILKYSLSYVFFRSRENSEWALIDLRPRHVALEVVAPQTFFVGHDQRELIREINDALTPFAASKINDMPPTMSLDMLAFPPDFRLPFSNGAEVKAQCNVSSLTPEGRRVCDAFANLSPVLT